VQQRRTVRPTPVAVVRGALREGLLRAQGRRERLLVEEQAECVSDRVADDVGCRERRGGGALRPMTAMPSTASRSIASSFAPFPIAAQ
jgi:hypothetical protein